MTPRLVSVLIAVCGLGSIGCDEASAPGADDSDPSVPATAPSDTSEALSAPSDPEPTAIQDDASPPPPAADSQHAAADPQPDNAQPRVPDPPAEAPIERRVTKRPLMVYFEPKLGTDFRGKLPSGAVFELYERVEGTGSGECRSPGWGRIGEAAFLCLRSTEPTEDEATVLPPRLVDGLAPFFYARRRPKRGDAEQPAAPRYRSRRAMTSGAEPEGFLDREHDYAFVGRRRYRGGAVLKTRNRRVVREADVKRMKPSDFAGRDTLDRPIPAGTTMTWSITWPYATVRAEPHPDAEVAGRLE
ncbi:MAG: hypothetical protein K0V04_09820, partial [Deltaproteobacteria bacterium]|nr:hypothetical protein [Deltaproteobacteria bacterium]